MRILLALLLYAVQPSGWWTVQTSGRDTNLRGVSATQNLSDKHFVIWASGSNGVVLRSVNDGNTWKQLTVEGGTDLDFRDIEAFDEKVVYLMSSGDGASRGFIKLLTVVKAGICNIQTSAQGFFSIRWHAVRSHTALPLAIR